MRGPLVCGNGGSRSIVEGNRQDGGGYVRIVYELKRSSTAVDECNVFVFACSSRGRLETSIMVQVRIDGMGDI